MTTAPGAEGADHCILLRSVPYRDADLVVTLFSRERGKLSALARGARRSTRRFGGALALYTVGRAELRPAHRGELWTLASIELLADFRAVAHDIAAMAHASYGLELVRELTAPEHPDPQLFDLLVDLLEVLVERAPRPAVLRAFELAVLDASGLAPILEHCVACGSEQPEALELPGLEVDVRAGGIRCGPCARGGTSARPLDPESRAHLAAAAAARAPSEMWGAEVSAVSAALARDAMVAMILHHIGKPLRSLEFIAKMSGAMLRSAHGDAYRNET